jgi:hypothetical protein
MWVPPRQVEYLALDVVAGLGRLTRLPLLAPTAGRFRPQHVDGASVALGEQVRTQGATVGVEAVGLCPQPEEDLLGDLLG